jgi:2,4-dienoyl-CoA reductase-like NADH-dependent reductase (Old Yellow Enzyme family)
VVSNNKCNGILVIVIFEKHLFLRLLLLNSNEIAWSDRKRRIKEAVNCPVMVVGGFRSYEVAEKTLKEDGMDYIAMARPLIREPALANRWQQGDRSPAKCISCNSCFMPGLEKGGIYCVIEKKEREKAARA